MTFDTGREDMRVLAPLASENSDDIGNGFILVAYGFVN
jgi:hypothetical protein